MSAIQGRNFEVLDRYRPTTLYMSLFSEIFEFIFSNEISSQTIKRLINYRN